MDPCGTGACPSSSVGPTEMSDRAQGYWISKDTSRLASLSSKWANFLHFLWLDDLAAAHYQRAGSGVQSSGGQGGGSLTAEWTEMVAICEDELYSVTSTLPSSYLVYYSRHRVARPGCLDRLLSLFYHV